MKFKHKLLAAALGVAPLSAWANIVVYHQDFESGLNANEEIVFADNQTRHVSGNPHAVTGRNWDVHHKDTNPDIDGSGTYGQSANLQGNVLGHVYKSYDNYEDNYFQVNDLSLSNQLEHLTLKFDFDSWIERDVDGFAVSVCNGTAGSCGSTGTSAHHGFRRIDPTTGSDMQYRDLSSTNPYDNSLNKIADGDDSHATVFGFDGAVNDSTWGTWAGTAMFDLSDYAGQTIALRFAFASDSASDSTAGINIDNIKVTGKCANGSTNPDCSQPNTGVPEPTSLSLALLGMAGLYRRRSTGRWL